jgi:hypothetical protein
MFAGRTFPHVTPAAIIWNKRNPAQPMAAFNDASGRDGRLLIDPVPA